MKNIKFNQYESYNDFGLLLETREGRPTSLIKKDLTTLNNGKILTTIGGRDPLEVNLTFIKKDLSDYEYKLISNWINDIQDNRLMTDEEEYTCYIVKNIECTLFQKVYENCYRIALKFICEPYLRYVIEDDFLITSSTSIMNYENNVAYPYIKIVGNGDIDLIVNGNISSYKNVSGYIELDCELQECYKNNTLKNSLMNGDFPQLEKGLNTISYNGNITEILIKPRWRV